MREGISSSGLTSSGERGKGSSVLRGENGEERKS